MKRLKTWALVVALSCFCQAAFAQINESDTLLLQYASAAGGSWQTGNLDALAFRAKAEASLAPAPFWAFKTQNSYRYQEFFDRKADEDIYSRNFLYGWQQRRVYPFAMLFVSTNFRRKINFRHFEGAGATWQVVRQPQHTVKISLSAVYELTRFADDAYNYSEYDGSPNIQTWRATTWIFGKHALANNHLRLHYEAFVQPSLQRANNFRWQAEIGLEWPIWKGLSFSANYIFTHENIVVSTVKPNDRLLTFGIAYNGKVKSTP